MVIFGGISPTRMDQAIRCARTRGGLVDLSFHQPYPSATKVRVQIQQSPEASTSPQNFLCMSRVHLVPSALTICIGFNLSNGRDRFRWLRVTLG